MSSQVIEGTVNFSNVTQHDVFNGQDTGTFSMTITMSDDDAATLAAQGVKIKDYEGAKQRKFKSKYSISMYDARKFKSKYSISMYDAEGDRYNGEVPYNSRVRLKFKTGPAHPVHGTPVYLEAVKVLEEAEVSAEAADF
jgi:hypothetical protein